MTNEHSHDDSERITTTPIKQEETKHDEESSRQQVLSTSFTKEEQQQQLHTARKLLFLFSSLYTFFFAGAFYGWGPMQLLLEEDGAFSWKCSDSSNENANYSEEEQLDDEVCPEQTKTLLNVQFVSIVISLALAPGFGHLIDKFGVPKMVTFMTISCCMGITLLMVASSTQTDQLLFVAFLCIGLMVTNTSVLTVKTGLVFETEESQQRVISALNTFFDAGSITYLGLWKIGNSTLLQSHYDDKLVILAGGYLSLAILCFGGALYYWRRVNTLLKSCSSQQSEQQQHQEDIDLITIPPTDTTTTDTTSQAPIGGNQEESDKRGAAETTNLSSTSTSTQHSSSNTDAIGSDLCVESTLSETAVQVQDNSTRSHDSVGDSTHHHHQQQQQCHDHQLGHNKHYVKISERKSSAQLKSAQFLYLVIFFSCHVARNIFNLTTARDFLAYLGDDKKGNKYLSIFTILLPASVIGLPLVDRVLQSSSGGGGYHAGLQSVNLLAICHGLVQVSNDNLNVQIIGFVVFSFYRCFLFAVTFSFLPVFLSGKVMGKAVGILVFAAGMATLTNIPLSNLAVTTFDGNFFWPNLFFIILVIPCIYLAWEMGQGIKREKESSISSTT